MSGWDAPTGNWDAREEPEESSGPDEPDYPAEPTAAYRIVPGSEGRQRAGRRGLPGYDQAESYDQATGSYAPAAGYDQGSSYGSGPGYGSASGYGQGTGTGQPPGYGTGPQRSVGPASGYPQGPASPGPQRTFGSGPQSPASPGPQRTFGSGPQSPASPGPQRALGPGPEGPVSTGPQRALGSGPRSPLSPAPPSARIPRAALGSGSQAAAGHDEPAIGGFPGYGAAEGTRPSWSGAGDQSGYASQPEYASQPGYVGQPGYGSQQGYGAEQGYGADQGYGSRPGYGPEGSGGEPGYGQHAPGQGGFPPGAAGYPDQPQPDLNYQTEAYPQQGFEPADYSENGPSQNGPSQNGPSQHGYSQNGPSQHGYDQNGYGQNGYGQNGLGQNGSGTAAFGQGEYGRGGPTVPPVTPTPGPGRFPSGGGPAGQSHPAQDYQTEAYPRPGSDAPAGFGQDAGPGAVAQDSFDQGPGSGAYPQPGYGQPGYGQPGYGQDGYSADTYGQQPGGFVPPAALQDGYPQDAYAQPGLDPAGAPAYGDGDFASRGRPPRSGVSGPRPPRSGQRPPHRPGGIRMALYLAASVVGVVVIVFLVTYLTKKPPASPAVGARPSTGTGTTAAAAGPASGFAFTQAAKVGTYPLNKAATKEFTSAAETRAAPVTAKIKAQGAGQPGKPLVGIYNLTPVTSITATGYKGMVFVGYDGTFTPSAVIKIERAQLRSSRVVPAGPNGGEMVCGYDTSTGSLVSECVWATKTTFGQVEFIDGATPVKYPGASKLAVEVRKAVEVRAS